MPASRSPFLSALAELPWEESFLLRCRYGIGHARLSEAEIARRLGMSIAEMAETERQAVVAFGLFLLALGSVFDGTEFER